MLFVMRELSLLFFMYTFSSTVTTSQDLQPEGLEYHEKLTLVLTLKRTGPRQTQEKWEGMSTDLRKASDEVLACFPLHPVCHQVLYPICTVHHRHVLFLPTSLPLLVQASSQPFGTPAMASNLVSSHPPVHCPNSSQTNLKCE